MHETVSSLLCVREGVYVCIVCVYIYMYVCM